MILVQNSIHHDYDEMHYGTSAIGRKKT